MAGGIEVRIVSGGDCWLDGGAMFGVVPRPIWERQIAPDEKNRIRMASNCLLFQTSGLWVLVDTGYGGKAPPKVREIHRMEPGQPLLASLAAVGLTASDIDVVILTHLHFDHAGGGTFLDDGGRARPTFPRAKYIVQQAEWEDATAQLPELAGAYFRKDFLPLADADQLELIRGDAEILPGVLLRLVGGHTRGMQLVELTSGDDQLIYLADLCPTASHLRTFWTMSYDQDLLAVRRRKPVVLGEAADRNALVMFDHDPVIHAARLRRDPKDGVAVAETVLLPYHLGGSQE